MKIKYFKAKNVFSPKFHKIKIGVTKKTCPYLLYGIETWGHTLRSEQDILVKLQSRVLRLIFDCKRSDDAWRHNDSRICTVKQLYGNVIRKLCFKHHAGLLPQNVSESLMPDLYINQLQKRVTRVSLENMYNYKKVTSIADTPLKVNCIKIWNNLSLNEKTLPYM